VLEKRDLLLEEGTALLDRIYGFSSTSKVNHLSIMSRSNPFFDPESQSEVLHLYILKKRNLLLEEGTAPAPLDRIFGFFFTGKVHRNLQIVSEQKSVGS
jgi:hypothetical protein